ncbi:uncharacterized protein LOC130677174 [Microplitis mediator]|uniref:uncharacterized protein LOC130677174 n=1 Tax=Microplitis mediator TaxID=375433 RepID=UPI0025563C8A|nr:uncharacterized protein LOC130677174 [Microplitis mediator]
MQSSAKQEFTMEEEIWLREEMLRRPPQLILTPTTATTTTTLRTTSTTAPTTTATNTRKRPDIRLKKVQKVKYHLVKKVEPYDPTKPGFKRPTKRPVIRPASAEIIKLAKPVKATTNPGPLVISGPQSTAELVGESPHGKPNNPTSTNLDTGHVGSKEQPDNDDAFPARATASFPKKKRRIGGQRRESTATNPGPLKKSSPQLGKSIQDADLVSRSETTTTTRPGRETKEIVTNPGPFKKNGPQLAELKPGKKVATANPGPLVTSSPQFTEATWLDYDEAPLLEDYPEYFDDQPGDLFPSRHQTRLEQLLLSLTPLVEVRPKVVAKRVAFTAYDGELRLFKVVRYRCTPIPKVETLDKTVHQLLNELEEKKSAKLTSFLC